MANSAVRKRKKSKFGLILILLVLITIISLMAAYGYYKSAIGPVSNDNEDKVLIEIASGSTSEKISTVLYDNGLIKNKT